MRLRWSIPLPGPLRISGGAPGKGAAAKARTGARAAHSERNRIDRREAGRAHVQQIQADARQRRADDKAGRDRYHENLAALRAEEQRLADNQAVAEQIVELEATARMHAAEGMPVSAAEFERMAVELRAQRPDVSARVRRPEDVAAVPVRDPGPAARPISRSLLGGRDR